MKIDPKDRSQLLRMAGNILDGMIAHSGYQDHMPEEAAQVAILTLEAVDKEIAERNKDA